MVANDEGILARAPVRRVREALTAAGATGQVRVLPESAATAAAAAAALGVPVAAIASSLLFDLDGAPLLVLTSGARRVDTERVGLELGGTLRRMSADQVRAATGQSIGGVAPVGHPARLRTVLSADLVGEPVLWAAAGHPRAVFPTTFTELVTLTGGTVLRRS